MDDIPNILSIILVSKGTKGDKLLFLYPFSPTTDLQSSNLISSSTAVERDRHHKLGFLGDNSSPFTLRKKAEWKEVDASPCCGLSEEMMAYLFTVKPELCGQKLELKIEDVRFVGFPLATSVRPTIDDDDDLLSIILFNVVIAIPARARKSLVQSFQGLSQRIAIALHHEEERCGYLSRQAKLMMDCHEEVQAMPEGQQDSPYRLMLERSELAQHLKVVFQDITERGTINIYINNWIEISFCVPEKVYFKLGLSPCSPEKILKALDEIKPFHALLLLEEASDIVASLPLDSSPSLSRLIGAVSPLKSILTLSSDLNLPLSQLCLLVRHLVSWGKALVIFPLCENNVYYVSPDSNFGSRELSESFAEVFSGRSLVQVLSQFSSPTSVAELTDPLQFEPQEQAERVRMLVWLLRHRLIAQLHTFVYFCPSLGLGQESQGHWEQPDWIKDSMASLRDIMTPEHYQPLVSLVQEESCRDNKTLQGDLRLFSRLYPYFNGEHHLEEIMYLENMRRSELVRVLDRFQRLLATTLRHDRLTSLLQSP